MALPITNLKISDIVKILGMVAKQVNISNLHLSPNVVGTGLDATYCPGITGYDRLAELRKLPYEIGRFRNYDPNIVNYRVGLLYRYFAIYPDKYSHSVHIPIGWRIATYADWVNILYSIQPSGNWLSNIVGNRLKSIYREADSTRFGWRGVINYDKYGFKGIASGVGQFTFDGIATWAQTGLLSRFWLQDIDYDNRAVQLDQHDDLVMVNLTDIYGDKHYQFCSIRLVREDSNNTGSVIDIDGNIYKTIKIGNTVITAENIRTKTNDIYEPMRGYNAGDSYIPSYDLASYINTELYDIP